jgi:ribosomal protein L30E
MVVFRVGNLIIRSKEKTKNILEERARVFMLMKIFPACFEKCVAFSFNKLWASPIFYFKQSSISLALGCTWGCPHIASHLERVVEAVSSNNPFALSSLFS